MKFSVILTTYNRGDSFLQQSIDSVVNQTYNDWELLIYDNYSTDNTDEIVAQYKSSKIKYRKYANDGVIAKSRNLGIYDSSGEYVGLIDSDDFWEKEKLYNCSHHLKSGKYKGICHAENWLFDDGKKMVVNYGPKSRFIFSNLLNQGNCLSPSATLVSRNVLKNVGGFSENPIYTTAEDYDLWLKISKRHSNFFFSNEILGNFRVHSSSLSYDTQKNINAVNAVIRKHCINTSIDESIPLSRCYLNGAKVLQIRGEYLSALSNYIKSIKTNCFYNYSWILIFTLLIPHKIFVLIYDKKKSRTY